MNAADLAQEVAGQLSLSGSPSPGPEARTLVAHVLGVEPSQLFSASASEQDRAALQALVEQRASGVPLQHITGVAWFRYVTLAVGPGVFIPRPETEELVGWALTQLAQRPKGRRRVVELCAGSGAITASLARELGHVELHAVERSAEAHSYLRRNLEGLGVDIVLGDMAEAFHELDGTVDLVIVNPPYVPEGHRLLLPSDVLHDPAEALFAGEDGLAALHVVADVARRLLRPDGWLATEHDDSHAPAVVALLEAAGFRSVVSHPDLTGRPRYATAAAPHDDGRMAP